MGALMAEKCSPCQKGDERIHSRDVLDLLEELDGWETRDIERKLLKRWDFRNYAAALRFVMKVSALAEMEGHHPDISFGWGYVEITLSTHAVEGLSRNDFILAAKIDGLDPQA